MISVISVILALVLVSFADQVVDGHGKLAASLSRIELRSAQRSEGNHSM